MRSCIDAHAVGYSGQDGRISTKYLLLSSLPACVLQILARQTGTQYDSTVPGEQEHHFHATF